MSIPKYKVGDLLEFTGGINSILTTKVSDIRTYKILRIEEKQYWVLDKNNHERELEFWCFTAKGIKVRLINNKQLLLRRKL